MQNIIKKTFRKKFFFFFTLFFLFFNINSTIITSKKPLNIKNGFLVSLNKTTKTLFLNSNKNKNLTSIESFRELKSDLKSATNNTEVKVVEVTKIKKSKKYIELYNLSFRNITTSKIKTLSGTSYFNDIVDLVEKTTINNKVFFSLKWKYKRRWSIAYHYYLLFDKNWNKIKLNNNDYNKTNLKPKVIVIKSYLFVKYNGYNDGKVWKFFEYNNSTKTWELKNKYNEDEVEFLNSEFKSENINNKIKFFKLKNKYYNSLYKELFKNYNVDSVEKKIVKRKTFYIVGYKNNRLINYLLYDNKFKKIPISINDLNTIKPKLKLLKNYLFIEYSEGWKIFKYNSSNNLEQKLTTIKIKDLYFLDDKFKITFSESSIKKIKIIDNNSNISFYIFDTLKITTKPKAKVLKSGLLIELNSDYEICFKKNKTKKLYNVISFRELKSNLKSATNINEVKVVEVTKTKNSKKYIELYNLSFRNITTSKIKTLSGTSNFNDIVGLVEKTTINDKVFFTFKWKYSDSFNYYLLFDGNWNKIKLNNKDYNKTDLKPKTIIINKHLFVKYNGYNDGKAWRVFKYNGLKNPWKKTKYKKIKNINFFNKKKNLLSKDFSQSFYYELKINNEEKELLYIYKNNLTNAINLFFSISNYKNNNYNKLYDECLFEVKNFKNINKIKYIGYKKNIFKISEDKIFFKNYKSFQHLNNKLKKTTKTSTQFIDFKFKNKNFLYLKNFSKKIEYIEKFYFNKGIFIKNKTLKIYNKDFLEITELNKLNLIFETAEKIFNSKNHYNIEQRIIKKENLKITIFIPKYEELQYLDENFEEVDKNEKSKLKYLNFEFKEDKKNTYKQLYLYNNFSLKTEVYVNDIIKLNKKFKQTTSNIKFFEVKLKNKKTNLIYSLNFSKKTKEFFQKRLFDKNFNIINDYAKDEDIFYLELFLDNKNNIKILYNLDLNKTISEYKSFQITQNYIEFILKNGNKKILSLSKTKIKIKTYYKLYDSNFNIISIKDVKKLKYYEVINSDGTKSLFKKNIDQTEEKLTKYESSKIFFINGKNYFEITTKENKKLLYNSFFQNIIEKKINKKNYYTFHIISFNSKNYLFFELEKNKFYFFSLEFKKLTNQKLLKENYILVDNLNPKTLEKESKMLYFYKTSWWNQINIKNIKEVFFIESISNNFLFLSYLNTENKNFYSLIEIRNKSFLIQKEKIEEYIFYTSKDLKILFFILNSGKEDKFFILNNTLIDNKNYNSEFLNSNFKKYKKNDDKDNLFYIKLSSKNWSQIVYLLKNRITKKFKSISLLNASFVNINKYNSGKLKYFELELLNKNKILYLKNLTVSTPVYKNFEKLTINEEEYIIITLQNNEKKLFNKELKDITNEIFRIKSFKTFEKKFILDKIQLYELTTLNDKKQLYNYDLTLSNSYANLNLSKDYYKSLKIIRINNKNYFELTLLSNRKKLFESNFLTKEENFTIFKNITNTLLSIDDYKKLEYLDKGLNKLSNKQNFFYIKFFVIKNKKRYYKLFTKNFEKKTFNFQSIKKKTINNNGYIEIELKNKNKILYDNSLNEKLPEYKSYYHLDRNFKQTKKENEYEYLEVVLNSDSKNLYDLSLNIKLSKYIKLLKLKINKKSYIEIELKNKNKTLYDNSLSKKLPEYKSFSFLNKSFIKTKKENEYEYLEVVLNSDSKNLYDLSLNIKLSKYIKLLKLKINKKSYIEIVFKNKNKTLYDNSLKKKLSGYKSIYFLDINFKKTKKELEYKYIEVILFNNNKKLFDTQLKEKLTEYKNFSFLDKSFKTTIKENEYKYLETVLNSDSKNLYDLSLNIKLFKYKKLNKKIINNQNYIEVEIENKNKTLYDQNLINQTKKLLKVNSFFKLYNNEFFELKNKFTTKNIKYIEVVSGNKRKKLCLFLNDSVIVKIEQYNNFSKTLINKISYIEVNFSLNNTFYKKLFNFNLDDKTNDFLLKDNFKFKNLKVFNYIIEKKSINFYEFTILSGGKLFLYFFDNTKILSDNYIKHKKYKNKENKSYFFLFKKEKDKTKITILNLELKNISTTFLNTLKNESTLNSKKVYLLGDLLVDEELFLVFSDLNSFRFLNIDLQVEKDNSKKYYIEVENKDYSNTLYLLSDLNKKTEKYYYKLESSNLLKFKKLNNIEEKYIVLKFEKNWQIYTWKNLQLHTKEFFAKKLVYSKSIKQAYNKYRPTTLLNIEKITEKNHDFYIFSLLMSTWSSGQKYSYFVLFDAFGQQIRLDQWEQDLEIKILKINKKKLLLKHKRYLYGENKVIYRLYFYLGSKWGKEVKYKTLNLKTIHNIQYFEFVNENKEKSIYKYDFSKSLEKYKNLKSFKFNQKKYIEVLYNNNKKKIYTLDFIDVTKKLLKVDNYLKVFNKNLNEIKNLENLESIEYVEFFDSQDKDKKVIVKNSNIRKKIDIKNKINNYLLVKLNNKEYIVIEFFINKKKHKKLYDKDLNLNIFTIITVKKNYKQLKIEKYYNSTKPKELKVKEFKSLIVVKNFVIFFYNNKSKLKKYIFKIEGDKFVEKKIKNLKIDEVENFQNLKVNQQNYIEITFLSGLKQYKKLFLEDFTSSTFAYQTLNKIKNYNIFFYKNFNITIGFFIINKESKKVFYDLNLNKKNYEFFYKKKIYSKKTFLLNFNLLSDFIEVNMKNVKNNDYMFWKNYIKNLKTYYNYFEKKPIFYKKNIFKKLKKTFLIYLNKLFLTTSQLLKYNKENKNFLGKIIKREYFDNLNIEYFEVREKIKLLKKNNLYDKIIVSSIPLSILTIFSFIFVIFWYRKVIKTFLKKVLKLKKLKWK